MLVQAWGTIATGRRLEEEAHKRSDAFILAVKEGSDTYRAISPREHVQLLGVARPEFPFLKRQLHVPPRLVPDCRFTKQLQRERSSALGVSGVIMLEELRDDHDKWPFSLFVEKPVHLQARNIETQRGLPLRIEEDGGQSAACAVFAATELCVLRPLKKVSDDFFEHPAVMHTLKYGHGYACIASFSLSVVALVGVYFTPQERQTDLEDEDKDKTVG
ncbi:uncharacterized protein BKA78DRAFT_372165 [Phyllosticta capitalensis]|uniref:uncharacterized protein n=1 Tax=Phyllosticta capitalensis TaxID=121624 RepID=UPI00312E039F